MARVECIHVSHDKIFRCTDSLFVSRTRARDRKGATWCVWHMDGWMGGDQLRWAGWDLASVGDRAGQGGVLETGRMEWTWVSTTPMRRCHCRTRVSCTPGRHSTACRRRGNGMCGARNTQGSRRRKEGATKGHENEDATTASARMPGRGQGWEGEKERFGWWRDGRKIRNRAIGIVQKPVRKLLANDLWRRILVTLALVALTRLGHFLPLPGFDRRFLPAGFLSPVTGVLDGLGDMSSEVSLNIMQLGISPYIGASIITQVACVFVPWFVRQRKEEGAAGMDAINRVTKYIALGIALLQSAYLALACAPFTVMTRFYFLTTTLLLTAGSMIVMFIAEAITEHGIGNGTTIIICLSILAGYASAMDVMVQKIMLRAVPVSYLVGTLAFFVAMTLGGIFVTETMRKVPISYFQIEGGRRTPASLHGEQTKYIPFKINPTGMQPVLVAAYALDFPRWIAQLTGSAALQNFSRILDPTIPALPGGNPALYYMVYFLVVFGSTFIDLESTPKEASEYLMKVGARVKGVRPGFQTVEFFRRVRTSTRFWGGILLGILATVSAVFDSYMRNLVGSYIGCTSLLIVVGMIISTKRQIQAYHQLPVLDRILHGELSGAGVATSPSR